MSIRGYLTPLFKLSITMLDSANIQNKEKENISTDDNTNIFDLKKYVKELLNFIEKMIKDENIFDKELKLSIMPGLISKLTKLMQSADGQRKNWSEEKKKGVKNEHDPRIHYRFIHRRVIRDGDHCTAHRK